jgi:hypothetical protein
MTQAAKSAPRRDRKEPSDWTFDRSYRALGYGFRVQTDVARLGALVDSLLSPFRIEEANELPTYLLRQPEPGKAVAYLDGREFATTVTPAGVVDQVLYEVNQEAIRRTSEYLLVHAAAASWRGRGLVFPAPMDSGKTTLVAGLIRAGLRYLTDEAALIGQDGSLHPYPKTLGLRPPSMEAIPELQKSLPPEFAWRSRLKYHVRPQDLRPRSIGRPCPVGYVIVPSYSRGSRNVLESLGSPEALMELATNCFNLNRFGATGLALLAGVVRNAQCYKLRMGDLDGAVTIVLDLVRGRTREGR